MAKTASQRYKELEALRQPFLDRGREAAKLTLPHILPPEGYRATKGGTKLHQPWQSIGARGVNNLASKILFVALPPNTPFFRLKLDDSVLEEMTQEVAEGVEDPEQAQQMINQIKTDMEEGLSKIESRTMDHVEQIALRIGFQEATKHLIVTGNALVYLPDSATEGLRVFGLDRYVVLRDASGNVMEIITKESVGYSTLDDEIKDRLTGEKYSRADNHTEIEVELYTWIERHANEWRLVQWADGVRIDDTEGTHPLDSLPWMPLRWNRVDGEDYGRGLVEEYIGDMRALEGLSRAIVQFAAGAARVVGLNDPNGMTDTDDVVNAADWDVIDGRAGDISFLQIEKYPDFQVAKATADEITRRLMQAFLMVNSIQRDGERVTAEEIRYMASELEDTLGGVYSTLAQEFQRPLVGILLDTMRSLGRIPKLPKDLVNPQIITGLEALGRGHDLKKLDAFLLGLRDMFGPEALAREVHVNEYLKRRAAALGVEHGGLVKTAAEKEAEALAEMERQMAMQATQQGIQSTGKMAEEGMKQP